MDSPHDVIGTAYEIYVASHLKGERGQYFTNRLVINMMVKMASPTERDIILDKTTPRLIQFHTLKNAVNPPFLGGFLIFGTMVAWVGRRPCQGGLLFSVVLCNDRKTIVTE